MSDMKKALVHSNHKNQDFLQHKQPHSPFFITTATTLFWPKSSRSLPTETHHLNTRALPCTKPDMAGRHEYIARDSGTRSGRYARMRHQCVLWRFPVENLPPQLNMSTFCPLYVRSSSYVLPLAFVLDDPLLRHVTLSTATKN